MKYFLLLQGIWRQTPNLIKTYQITTENILISPALIMKIKLFFNPQALKNIKPTLELIYKLLQTQQPLPKVYLVYFIKTKNIRILIDSDKNPTVISLGSQMLNSESFCVLKQDKQMVSIAFQNTQMFFDNFIRVLEKDDQFGLWFDVKRQNLDGKELKFMKLTFKNNDRFLSRISIETPKYDISEIKFHHWICGCLENNRQIEFVIYLDELLNMMRYLLKLKPIAGTKLLIDFDLSSRTFTSRSSDQHCLPNTQGEIKIITNSSLQNQFQFQISISDLKIVNQMIRKFKQLKVIISSDFHFIFVFMKQDLFVCHVDMFQWINSIRENIRTNSVMKMEEVHEVEELEQDERWD